MEDIHSHSREEVIDAFTQERLQIIRERRLTRVLQLPITSLTLAEAYEVQRRVINFRIAQGERLAGWKVGCTSPSIQTQFGLSQPICGRLLYPNVHINGTHFKASSFVECAVEAEMVFRIGNNLSPGMNDSELLSSIASVHSGIELHHYRFWYGDPTSQELIASNGIHAGLVIGEAAHSTAIGLNLERMEVVVNGEPADSGRGEEVMGGPLHSLRWLVDFLAARGEQVRRDDFVIPGSATKLVRVKAGDRTEARFSTLGSCRMLLL